MSIAKAVLRIARPTDRLQRLPRCIVAGWGSKSWASLSIIRALTA